MTTLLEIEPRYQDALREAGLTSFDDFMRMQTGPAISSHKIRSTAPVELIIDGGTRRCFLKRNLRVPLKHAILPLFKGRPGFSQPRLEWNVLGELAGVGIPAMSRIAMGERRKMGLPVSSFLLVEAVPMAHTLEDWLVPGFPKPTALEEPSRLALLRDLGALLRSLSNAGFDWPDLHAKHVFAAPSQANHSTASWQLMLIDVERMRRAVGRSSARRSDVKRLLKSLLPFRPAHSELSTLLTACGLNESCAAELAQCESPRLPDEFEHPRSLKMTRGTKTMFDARFESLLAANRLDSLDRVFTHQAVVKLDKPGLRAYRDRNRIELHRDDGSPVTVFLKRYTRPPLVEQLRRIREVGPGLSSAVREIRFIRKLTELGLPTMKIVSFGQEMSGPLERRSFAMTEGIDGVSLERLEQQARIDPETTPSVDDRREIIRQLALIVRLMHAARIYHRDLYLCHVFLSRNADGRIVLHLIDLARMIEKPMRPMRWKVKDLAALNYSAHAPWVTRADRIRFLRTYMGTAASRDSLRRLCAAVISRTRRMARHDRHRKNATAVEPLI